MLKRPAILCASLLFGAVFAFGLVRLFELRFDRGDIYPPYSTLRTDPLGASVFYESLNDVPGVTAQRYFEETFKSDDGQAHALFVLGAQPDSLKWLSRSEFATMQRFVFNGGRVVVSFYPEASEPWSARSAHTNETDSVSGDGKKPRHGHSKPDQNAVENKSETNNVNSAKSLASTNHINSTNVVPPLKHTSSRNERRHKNSPDDQDQQDKQDENDLKSELLKYADLSKEWGFDFEYKNLGTNDDGEIKFPSAQLVAASRDLPALLPIHTVLCFTNLTNGWVTIYQRDKKMPVVVERKFGAGSVVLVADSYPFSNEALFKDRSAPLLAWLLGSGRDAIFDEAHLGIVEQPGMATLMRRYQLHGLIFSLLLVAVLFVWKNSVSLVPPHAETKVDAGPVVAGRDSASGFVNLVRRGISPAEIINVCFAEWKKSGARLAAVSPAQRRDLEQLIQQQAALEPHQRKPVENYRVISQILKRRK
jgi:hypothetical protein